MLELLNTESSITQYELFIYFVISMIPAISISVGKLICLVFPYVFRFVEVLIYDEETLEEKARERVEK